MPMIYGLSLATAGNLTTSGVANTETGTFFVKAGTGRNVGLRRVDVVGKAAGASTISGIAFRVVKFATASTAGTGMTPQPRDPGMQAAKASSASRPTVGSTRTNHIVFGCGAAGPGGWAALDADDVLTNEAGSAGSIDVIDVSGSTSLNFEFSAQIQE